MINENVFYLHVKISNMSPTLWLRESRNDKKNIITNLKNSPDLQKKKSSYNFITPDVIAEFQMITLENDKLKSENALLKTEYFTLRKENENLLGHIQMNQDKFEQQISLMRDEIRINETNFMENNKKYLMQKKKFMEEVICHSLLNSIF